MLFTEASFVFLFLPVVLLLTYSAPRSARNSILLLASLLFYYWGEGRYAAVMLVSIVMNWAFGLLIDRAEGRPRQAWLGVAVAANLSLLGFFKYANFFARNLGRLLLLAGLDDSWTHLQPIHLPIGISFFTFEALSYVIDVARRHVASERNPFQIALYITRFPQLTAGPIVRYIDVVEQLRSRDVDIDGFAEGIRRFVIGLAKKMLIANQLAAVADSVFGRPPGELSAPLAWLGAFCYMGQIYFDFSGYSDMAIGLARMFGFYYMENFNYPYIATSITDFWRRWHISLSTWFRDYLYIPLGGNRLGPRRTYFNLIFVFLVCGFWHGAAWSFVIWGLYHGLFLVIERLLGVRPGTGPASQLKHLYTLLVVLGGWVIFRSPSLRYAVSFFGAMAGLGTGNSPLFPALFLTPSFILTAFAAILFSTPIPVEALRRFGLWPADYDAEGLPRRLPVGLRGAVSLVPLALMFVLSLMMIAQQSYNPFIYYRF